MNGLFQKIFAQPVFPGEEDRSQQARQLNTILLVNLVLIVLGLSIMLASSQYVSPVISMMGAAMVGGLALLRREVFRGRLKLVSYTLVLAPSFTLTVFLYLSGTTRTPLVAGYVLVVVMAGLLLRRGAMVAVMLLCVLEFSLLTLLSALNRLPLPNTQIVADPLFQDWMVFAPLLVYTGMFTFWIQQNIIDLLVRARREVTERRRVEEELRRSRDFFQGVMNALEDPVLVKDGRQRWLMLNESACELLGHPLEQLIGKGDADFFPPEFVARYGQQDREVLETGKTMVFEEQILINNQPRTIAAKKSRYIDPATGERFVAASIRDITERRRMQEELEQAHTNLEQQVLERTAELIAANRTLLDEIDERRVVEAALLRAQGENDAFMKAAPGFMYLFRPDGSMVRWNKRLNEALGYTDEELSRSSVIDFLGFERSTPVPAVVLETLYRGEVVSDEMVFHAKDGHTFPVYVSLAGVLNEDGLRYIVAIGIDISDRKAAEDALRESEQRYRTLVEASPDFILVFDDQLRILYANPSLRNTSGMEDMRLYISAESQDWLRVLAADFLQGGQPYSGTIEQAFPGPDGSLRWYSGVLARIIYQGKPALLAIARDVTERKQTEAALAQSQERMRALLDATHDLSFLVTPEGNFMAVNQATADYIDIPREELLRNNLFDLMDEQVRGPRRQRVQEVARTGRPARFEDRSGDLWFDNTIYPVLAPDGSVELLAVFARDITERKQAEDELRKSEAELRRSEERYALAARGANDVLWDVDITTDTLYLSPRWMALLGYGEDHPMQTSAHWLALIHPEDYEQALLHIRTHLQGATPHYESEYRVRHEDGSYRWVLSRGLAVRDAQDRPYRMAGSITDISERKRIEARLLHDALHDAATGLPNRALLADRLEQAIKSQRRHPETQFAVLYMDLDRFKDINDSLGHSVGDQLLTAVSQRVQACLRETDTLARLGGDEFVILLPQVTGIDHALGIAERIQDALRQPFDLNGVQSFTSASIGVVISDGNLSEGSRATSEEMLRDADIAMYRAKALGRARCAVFDASMHSQVLLRMSLETDLRRAINEGGLEIHYMPIVTLNGSRAGCCESFEALVRWRHPERGLISPSDFIPLAEESLLIIPLDRWVLREACRQLQRWQQRWPELCGLKINVNLSSKQFAQPDLIDQITSTLRACELSPSCLRLEITESAIIENIELANRTLRHLQELGVQVEIDDFGTGFSALTYLYQLPVNTLKIDRSFTNQLGIDPRKTEIVQTLVSLAHNIGLDVVAEGVETPDQVERLKAMNCDYGQGFLFAKPMPVEEVEGYMEVNRP